MTTTLAEKKIEILKALKDDIKYEFHTPDAANWAMDRIRQAFTELAEERTAEIRGIIENMRNPSNKCYCREYSMGEHNCIVTSNETLDDLQKKI